MNLLERYIKKHNLKLNKSSYKQAKEYFTNFIGK